MYFRLRCVQVVLMARPYYYAADNDIEDDGVMGLANGLARNSGLHTLQLAGTGALLLLSYHARIACVCGSQ